MRCGKHHDREVLQNAPGMLRYHCSDAIVCAVKTLLYGISVLLVQWKDSDLVNITA
jgi:hypothetical protein